MAQGYDANSIFGRSFDTVVKNQIALRSSIVSSSTRTDEQIQYLNGRSAFVKLTSSVNIEGSSDPAKNNILFGGVLYNNPDLELLVQRSGIDENEPKGGAYTYSDALGYRPMPGIDSISVDSKNTFGTLRVAKVNFKCWNLEQLSILEKLYLRPGFSVLLEWGNTAYYGKNSSDFNTSPTTISNLVEDKNLSKTAIYQAIKNLKTSSHGNYDAMFGFIRNFLWSYRTDGGYDCVCDIVSIGELAEGLEVILSSKQSGDKIINSVEGTPPEYLKSPLHTLLKVIKDTPESGNIINPQLDEALTAYVSQGSTLQDRVARQSEILIPTTWKQFTKEVGITKFKIFSCKINSGETKEFKYIRLRDLLGLLNTILIKSPSETIVKFNLDRKQSRYLTFYQHFGLDPGVCIIPKSTRVAVFGFETILQYNIQALANILLNTEEDINGNNSILDLFLEVDFILEHLNKIYDSTGVSNRSLATFMRSILGDIQDNLGNINDLDYIFDEDSGQYFIIDRNLTPNRGTISESTINVTGLQSLVTNFSLTSKLPPNLSALIAISAQATGTDIGREMDNLLVWNRGLSDRVFPKKYITPPTDAQDKDNIISRIEEEALKLKEVLGIFNNEFSNSPTVNNPSEYSYDKEQILAAKSSHQFFSKTKVGENSSNTNTFQPAGIIPFELSITMDGISGLKITEAFKINKGILPSQYDKKTGFIITGLNHSVQNNRWETTIDAQLIII